MDRLKKKIILEDDAPSVAPAVPVKSSGQSENKKTAAPEAAKSVLITRAHQVIVRPLVTEKAASLQSAGHYSFIIKRGAGKQSVKQAIKELYGVEPIKVNVINMSGKQVRSGRYAGQRSDYKKAVVTLPPGKTITVHEGV